MSQPKGSSADTKPVGAAYRALSSSGQSTSGQIQLTSEPSSRAQQVVKQASSGGQATISSGTQRLSSIDILNENKQRQLQLKQQESFKLHLEQRQKLYQQQELLRSKQPGQDDLEDEAHNLAVLYQVNPNAPDYMKSAVMSQQQDEKKRQSAAGSLALNPFDTAPVEGQRRSGALSVAATRDGPDSGLVSGKSGFLAALMEPASQLDQSTEELQRKGANSPPIPPSRYDKVLDKAGSSYNYQDVPDPRPFYQRDLATLLQDCRASRKLVIVIVAIALLLDNMLLTSVVPIIPAYLYKLRIERQHRELLEKSAGAVRVRNESDGTIGGRPFGSNKIALDEEAINAELERRINQSIAAAQDRYSGSVFHPRIRPGLQPAVQPDDDADDDDEEEDGDGDRGAIEQGDKEAARLKLKLDRAAAGESAARTISRPASQARKVNKAATADRKPKLSDNEGGAGKDDDDDDEYEDTDSERPTKQARERAEFKPSRWTANPERDKTTGRGQSSAKIPPPSQSLPNPDDDDDEDSADAARWNKLRSSLMSLSRSNESYELGNMCLSMVLGAPGIDSAPSDPGPVIPKATLRRPTRMARTKARLAQVRPRPSPQPKYDEPAVSSTEASKKDDDELIISHQDIVDESFEVGVMFASKPIVQAFANPFIGSLTNRVGFTIPMFTGFVIMFLSTLVFAFGSTYSTLFIARAIQGVGSACTSVAGMSMLADRFPDDAERGNAMAIALGGLALGVVIGPPFGGFMYEFVGKSSPFIVLSILALLDGLLQLAVLQPRVTKSSEEGASLLTLIKDPYILVAAGAITFANTGIAILEPALPLWMMDTMQAKNWEQGVAFLPAALSYMLGTNLFGSLGHRIGRWRSAMIGLLIIGCSLLLIPFATRVDHLIVPNGAIGFAMGMVDSTMMPMLGYLVDIRHTSVYGSVYAIGDVAFCASFAFGPALSGTLVELIGFEGLVITTAFICFGFAPLLLLLRNPPARQMDEAQLRDQASLRYVNYSHLDSPDEDAHLTMLDSNKKTYVR